MGWTRISWTRRAIGALSALVVLCAGAGAQAANSPQPTAVSIPGTFDSELGCAGDWDPACPQAQLSFSADDDLWTATHTVPAGNWEYKAALNNTWDVHYGAGGVQNGPNISLAQPLTGSVTFLYDHKTHFATDSTNTAVAVAAGNFQSELGCAGDWDPGCLRSWLQDPDGDGKATLTTTALPAGNFETKVALRQQWDENYGAGGTPGGANIAFSVPSNGALMRFTYDSATHVLTIRGPDGAAPSITISSPANGATYTVGATVAAGYSCADAGGSGLATCSGPVGNGKPIDTAAPGPHSFTVRATDNDGNVATKTVDYAVMTGGGSAAPETTAPEPNPLAPVIPVGFARTARVADKAALSSALRRGLKVTFSCPRACRASARGLLTRRLATRLGLASRTVTIAKGSASLATTGEKTFVVKFTKKARRRLRRVKRVVLTVRTRIADATGAQTFRARVTLKRRA